MVKAIKVEQEEKSTKEWNVNFDVEKTKLDLEDPVPIAMRSKRQLQMFPPSAPPPIPNEYLRKSLSAINSAFVEMNVVSNPSLAKSNVSQVVSNRSSLDSENFDEKASHDSFLAALNDWRGTMSLPESKPKDLKTLPGSQPKDAILPINNSWQENDVSFDEKASHDSFVEALNEWRQKGVLPQENIINEPTGQESKSIETETKEGYILSRKDAFQSDLLECLNYKESMSYLDRLALNSMRAEMKNFGPIAEVEEVFCAMKLEDNEKEDILESTFEEDVLIESTFQDTTTKVRKIENTVNDELKMFDWRKEMKIEDITDNEDAFILECLSKGQMIECIPMSRMVYVDHRN